MRRNRGVKCAVLVENCDTVAGSWSQERERKRGERNFGWIINSSSESNFKNWGQLLLLLLLFPFQLKSFQNLSHDSCVNSSSSSHKKTAPFFFSFAFSSSSSCDSCHRSNTKTNIWAAVDRDSWPSFVWRRDQQLGSARADWVPPTPSSQTKLSRTDFTSGAECVEAQHNFLSRKAVTFC